MREITVKTIGRMAKIANKFRAVYVIIRSESHIVMTNNETFGAVLEEHKPGLISDCEFAIRNMKKHNEDA